jgi:glycosyltransferase involved in cell wall biosynthesis
MKVTISVKGRFHAFYLAKELQKKGYLNRLITTYPKFETIKYGIDKSNIISLWPYEVAQRLYKKQPFRLSGKLDLDYFIKEFIDRTVSNKLDDKAQIYVGWSFDSIYSIRKAKELGLISIIEQGNSHTLYAEALMEEEYATQGIHYRKKNPYITERELAAYNEADYISIASTFVKRSFIEKGFPEDKLLVNPYGVDLSHFKPIPKQDNKFRVIFCGNQSIRKGIAYLLQAFYELKLPNAELWFIGSPNNETQHLFKKYDAPNIIQKGHFPEFELHKYYSQGSVFCMPSIEEGLAMVQPQAMACGLPLICTTNTGGEDLIEEGKEGFVIPIRSVDVIKEKILYLYEHPDICEAMGKAAMQKVKQGFRWEDYGERMIGHYQKILGIN